MFSDHAGVWPARNDAHELRAKQGVKLLCAQVQGVPLAAKRFI
jgi:hypothetical protein